jgi:hypothetical protein
MLIDSLPTNATSSCEMNPARLPEALVPVAPDRPARSRYHERALEGIDTPRDEGRRIPNKVISSRVTGANTSQAVSARERHGKPQIVRKPSDWMASSRASVVQHKPTKTVFEVSARPDLAPADILTLEDFRARPVHRCEDPAPCTEADLEVLCGEAVLMALFLLGLAWPATVNAGQAVRKGIEACA